MSEKRRDDRNRILREGEYRRADGRYCYRYIDENGKEMNAYSGRLDKHDATPNGKKLEPSLREKEKQIQAFLLEHVVAFGGNYTVLELVEKYVSLKTGVCHSTRAGYKLEECFRNILKHRKAPKVEPIVNGYAGFLFVDKNGMPMVALHWEKYMQYIIEKYNKIYRVQMSKVTPHVCRQRC